MIILFDLDGTLIDQQMLLLQHFLHSFDKHNFDFKGNIEDIIKEIGYPLDIMFENLEFLELLFGIL